MPIVRPHAARFHERRISGVTLRRRFSTVMFTWGGHGPRARRFVRFWASGGANVTKKGDSLPWTPMNRRAKFDAARFILGGEILNRTNKQTNSKRYIHTLAYRQCVDNRQTDTYKPLKNLSTRLP